MANAEWGRFRTGQVDRLNVPTGPDSERATVGFGLHLFRHDGSPVSSAMRSQSRVCGTMVIIALWAVQPPRVLARG